MSCYSEYSVAGYIQSKDTLLERIQAIDLMILNALALTADTIAGAGGNIISYELDDQQAHIKTSYRSMADVTAGIQALKQLQQKYINRYNGRVFTLQNRGTFRR